MSEVMMAKKKSSKPPKESPASRRLSVQATPSWIAWVEEGAGHCRTDVSKLVDAALATYLKGQGFGKNPPKRVP